MYQKPTGAFILSANDMLRFLKKEMQGMLVLHFSLLIFQLLQLLGNLDHKGIPRQSPLWFFVTWLIVSQWIVTVFIDRILAANVEGFVNKVHCDRWLPENLFIMEDAMTTETPNAPQWMRILSVFQFNRSIDEEMWLTLSQDFRFGTDHHTTFSSIQKKHLTKSTASAID